MSLLDALSKRITVRGIDNPFPQRGFPIKRPRADVSTDPAKTPEDDASLRLTPG